MKPRTKLFAILALLTAITLNAQRSDPAKVMFEAARKKEVVDGDLPAAIAQYKAIVSNFKDDRAIVAEALIRMADCYQKLDVPESVKIYERIVAEYAEQRDAVRAARTRLGLSSEERPKVISYRKVLNNGSRSMSQDGRYVVHGRVVHDLVSGTQRQWHEDASGTMSSPSISRDGTKIAFEWCEDTCELQVATKNDVGAYNSRRLFRSGEVRLSPRDWSPDGKQISVTGLGKEGTWQIGLVNVQDGTLRVLKSVDRRGATGIFFSPDGLNLAFDLPGNGTSARRDIFVMATDDGRVIPAVVNTADDALMGWSADGKYLLFTSDRSGTKDLWALPFSGRKPQGNPELLKPNVSKIEVVSLGITQNGALYSSTIANERNIEFVSIDLDSGKAGMPVRTPQRYPGKNMEPAWSPDGKFLAYLSEREEDGFAGIVAIHSMDNGEVRESEPQLNLASIRGLNWSPDGLSIAFTAVDLKGRCGIFRMDASTGKVSPITTGTPAIEQGPFWSPDGQRIYYQANDGAVRELEMASGNERIILTGSRGGPISLSPDGHWIARYNPSTNGSLQSLVILSVETGRSRELLRLSDGEFDSNPMSWTPDSRAVLLRKWGRRAGYELQLVPINGETPRKLDIDLKGARPGEALGKIRLSPDGKHLAYVAGKPIYRSETWVLENFLPPAAGK